MKRIGHLFESIVDPDNLRLAFFKASCGKRHRDDQSRFMRNLEDEIVRIRTGLLDGSYPVGDYRRFMIYDPKEREICAASFGERVLHHAIMNICEPYFDKWLIFDSYACRKGKGQLAAVKRACKFASCNRWFMKCDIRKYFDSIPHDRLKAALSRKFKDDPLLSWFDRIIDSYEKTPGRGLPIGNLTSQHFANLYLDPLDRYLAKCGDDRASVLASRCQYIRYMDDFVFWCNDKSALVELRGKLVCFLRETLDLETKQEPFINRTDKGMDFLGMRIFPSVARLARSSRVRYGRKVKAYERLYERGVFDENELQSRVTALTAFAQQGDTLDWRRRFWAVRERHQATTVCCAAAAGTTTPGTAAPRTATATTPTTATTTTASAFVAPQHRRILRAVPVDGPFLQCGTNDYMQPDISSDVERFGLSYWEGRT